MVVATTTCQRPHAIRLEPTGLTRLIGGLIHGSLSARGDPALGPDLANVGGRGLEASAQPDERLRRDTASVPESTSGQRTHLKQGRPWWTPDGGGRGGAEGPPWWHEASFPHRHRPCGERGLSQYYAPAVGRGGTRVGAPPVSPGRELRERLEFSPSPPSLRRARIEPALRSSGGEAGGEALGLTLGTHPLSVALLQQ
jgi:hypothetical protein